MSGGADQPSERAEASAARAARRARRIGGRSNPAAAEPPAGVESTEVEAAGVESTEVEAAEDESTEVEAAEVAGVESDETEPATGGPDGARSSRLSWLPAAALAIVCLGFLGWGVYDSHGVWWARSSASVADERGPVLSAAKTCMAAMNTYDYRKLAQSEANGLACTTGTFTGQYKQAFEKLIKPQAAKVQFTQTAQINNAGIESVSGNGDQWVVLVFGQLSTTNSQTGTTAPTLTPFSARVTMQHVRDKWLVANYQYAPTS